LIEESNIIRFRERFQETENKRTQTFDVIIDRQSSQFERVMMKTTSNDENLSAKMKRVIHQANSIFRRERRTRNDQENEDENEMRTRNDRDDEKVEDEEVDDEKEENRELERRDRDRAA
jgi:hypothetical protein